MNKPKILLLDIETSPMIVHAWDLWDQNIALNQIEKDWRIISWAAKWHGKKHIMYKDQKAGINDENEKKILSAIWNLIDQADIIVTHNGMAFDMKKLNARFLYHGLTPPSSYKNIDTLRIAKTKFKMTSNKLEYLTTYLKVKHKKLKHKNFPGHELWTECLKGNSKAWKEMEKYNKYDVLGLEEVYEALAPWTKQLDPNLYTGGVIPTCMCGSTEFWQNGYFYTDGNKYHRYKCKGCGNESKSRKGLVTKEQRKALRA